MSTRAGSGHDEGSIRVSRTRSHRPERRLRARTVTFIGAIAVVALVAVSCGGSRSADPDAGVPDTTSAPQEAAATFGDLPTPCGPGDASGTTDQGVSDTSITIGYGDDAGFQGSPGLNHELTDAVEALMKWCNDQGGINGREVVGNYYDARVLDVNTVMADACTQVFMLVGQGWALDSSQENTRRSCELPTVPAYSVSAQFANAPLMYQPVPNPTDYTSAEIADTMAKAFPEEVKKTGLMYAGFPGTMDTKDKAVATYAQFGFEFLECDQTYAIGGESDYKAFAQRLKDCGAEVVYYAGGPPAFNNWLEAAAQLDYHPIVIIEGQVYNESFAAWNTLGLADNVYIRNVFTPLFEADASPATQTYVELVEASGGDVNQIGAQAASAFLLWATAAKACGSDLTRDCVLNELSQVHEWTGGGLHASGDPGANLPPECGLVVKLDGTEFVRYEPTEAGTFTCDPSYVVEVTGDIITRAKLDENRISAP